MFRRTVQLWVFAVLTSSFLAACGSDANPERVDEFADTDIAPTDVTGDAVADAVDTGIADASTDVSNTDVSSGTAPRDGLWSTGVSFAELGGLEIPAQLELSRVTDAQIGEIALRFVSEDGVSEVIAAASDVEYDSMGFVADFGQFALPAAFSPTGSDVGLELTATATALTEAFFCGTITGEVVDFGIDVTRSTFGAIPWDEQAGQSLPLDCEWEPGDVIVRETLMIGTDDRPARLDFPVQYDATESWPVVVVLHGFGATGEVQAQYFGLNALIDELGYLLVVPDGTANARGEQFWNATAACCGFGSDVDDLGYLSELVAEVTGEHAGDAEQVYFIGHSNGGFMSHRIACDRPDIVTGIVNLAGAGTDNAEDCQPTEPVGIVNIHGTNDATIEYDGRDSQFGFPSARALTERWAALNGCGAELTTVGSFDYEPNLEGEETVREDADACPVDGPVSLWTVNGGSHIPPFDSVTLTRDAFDVLGLRAQ